MDKREMQKAFDDPLSGPSPTSVQSGASFTISVPDHVILIKVESP